MPRIPHAGVPPAEPYQYAEWRRARLAPDYRVEILAGKPSLLDFDYELVLDARGLEQPDRGVCPPRGGDQDLGEDEDRLWDVATGMDPEDGVIWVYGFGEDGVMAVVFRRATPIDNGSSPTSASRP